MLEFLLVILLLLTFISLTIKSNVFFNYIRIKIKVIGLDIEIKSKEKAPHPAKISANFCKYSYYYLIAPKQNKCSKDTQCYQHWVFLFIYLLYQIYLKFTHIFYITASLSLGIENSTSISP